MTSSIEQKAQAATAARERLLEIRGRRGDSERRRATLRAECRHAEHEAAARALIPGGGTAVATAAEPLADLEAELERLETEEADAEAALERAEREYRETVLRSVPGLAEEAANAREALRAALAGLGEEALGHYRDVVAAEAKHRAKVAELDVLSNKVKGDPRLASRQRVELRNWLKATAGEASPEEIAGWLVARILGWSRQQGSPVEDYWRGEGVALRPGSVLMPGAPILIDDHIYSLRAGRLPL